MTDIKELKFSESPSETSISFRVGLGSPYSVQLNVPVVSMEKREYGAFLQITTAEESPLLVLVPWGNVFNVTQGSGSDVTDFTELAFTDGETLHVVLSPSGGGQSDLTITSFDIQEEGVMYERNSQLILLPWESIQFVYQA